MAPVQKKSNSRSANFSSSEVSILLSLVHKYKKVIEGKETDTNSNRQKYEAWQSLSNEFNALSGETPRDLNSIKNKYNNMKKKAKGNFAQERYYAMGTGGGPAKPSPVTDVDEQVKEILGKEIVIGDEAQFDSDTFQMVKEMDTRLDVPNNDVSSEILDMEIIMVEEANNEIGEAAGTGNEPPNKGIAVKRCEDWSTFAPQKLRTPTSVPLQGSKQGGRDIKGKLAEWTKEKAMTAEMKKKFLKDEHEMNMKHAQEKHEQYLEEGAERLRQMKEKHALEMELMREEHKAKIQRMCSNCNTDK